MAENKIVIHQAFYGEVNRAHSCIKETLLDPDLTSFLITFTDRPAALPPGVNLLPYLSGSAFSKYYVFTKTFPDKTATRAGMVFTHVLILNLEDILLTNNLQDILSHFVQSTENKSDEIREFELKISDASASLSSKSQPKYIQETISAFISGVSPILFSGDISTFSNALQQIWNSPNTSFRKKIRFRTSFTSSDIESVKDLTIVSIQKDFLPKWQGQKIVHGESQDKVEINSLSEALFLGHKNENPFYNFLLELNVNLSEVQSYGQYEKIFTNYTSLNKIDDANIVRQDIRALTKISPSLADGQFIKEKFVDRLATLIQDKKDSNLKALRNIDWASLPNGEGKSKQIVSSFIEGEIENPNQKQFQNLSELIVLSTSDNEQNWWHTTISESISKVFKKQSEVTLKNIWQLIDFSESSLKSILSIISTIQSCDVILRKSVPEKLRIDTCKSIVQLAKKKNWYLLHADILLKQFSVETSIEQQLKFEENLSLADSVGVNYLTAKLAPNKLIDLALKTKDKKLIELSAEEIEKDTSLLKDIDLLIPSWLNIWTTFVVKTKKVFAGLVGQEKKVVFAVLDLIISGENVNDTVISLIAESPFSDLSQYQDREKVWQKIKNPYKQKFLSSTTQGVFKNFLSGKIEVNTIENPISEKITSDLFMSAFLSENRNNIQPVITVFSSFKNLKDNFLADYISYFRGTITEAQSKNLGELIRDNKFNKSARSVYEKSRYNSSFSLAYDICKGLVSLNWLEKLSVFSTKHPKQAYSFTVPVMSKEDSLRIELPTVAILTAINEEYSAVRAHLKEIVEADQNDTNYEAGIFEFNGKEIAKVFIRECGAKNTTAAQETERAIQYFRPNLMFFVGIAGSRKPQDFSIGDVIFPEKVYSYEGGKSGKDSFVARPDVAAVTYTLKEIAKKERRKDNWKVLVKGNWSENFKADLGVIASGEQVVEHYDSEVGKILSKYYNDTSAIEMEGFGFANAASRQGRNTSNFLIGIVRGISDIIEQPSIKTENYNTDRRPAHAKKLASDTAAAFAYWLIMKVYEK